MTTLTFKNDPDILKHCNKLHEQFVKSVSDSIGANNFTTMMFFQPLPVSYGRLGQKRGGNMLGLEDMEGNAIMFTGEVMVKSDAASFAVAKAGLHSMTAALKDYSVSVGGEMDLVYLNYADPSQDSIGSYGVDKVQYLRDVSAKYDPTGIFQKRFPRGFKLDRVT